MHAGFPPCPLDMSRELTIGPTGRRRVTDLCVNDRFRLRGNDGERDRENVGPGLKCRRRQTPGVPAWHFSCRSDSILCVGINEVPVDVRHLRVSPLQIAFL